MARIESKLTIAKKKKTGIDINFHTCALRHDGKSDESLSVVDKDTKLIYSLPINDVKAALEDSESSEIETCNAYDKEYNPNKTGGIVNGHPFCQECIIGMAEQSVSNEIKLDEAIELLKGFSFFCIDMTREEHCEEAVKVQEFLKTTSAREWVENQLALSKCNVCDNEELEKCKFCGEKVMFTDPETGLCDSCQMSEEMDKKISSELEED